MLFSSIAQLSHTAIIQPAFSLFWCEELADGSKALRLAPHLECDSDETGTARIVACASLGVWGVAFPIFLGVLIKLKFGTQEYSFSLVSFGYKRPYVNWEAWVSLRRFLVLLLITFLRRDLAAFALLVLMWLSAIVLVKCSPFINWLTNMAHYGTDFLVLIILLVGLVSVVVDASEGVDGLSMLVIICLTFVLAAITTLIVIEVLSTIVLPQSKLHSVWARESLRKQVPNLYTTISAKLTKWSSIQKTQKKAAAAKAMHDDAADVPTAIATNSSVPWVRSTQSGFAPDVGPHCSCNSNGCAHAAEITLRIDDKKTMNLEHSTCIMTARPPADAIDYYEGALLAQTARICDAHVPLQRPSVQASASVSRILDTRSSFSRSDPIHLRHLSISDPSHLRHLTGFAQPRTVGTRVMHPIRGGGHVVKVDSDDPRGRPVHVSFDNGEHHQYTWSSAAQRLEQVEEQSTPKADLVIFTRVVHPALGGGRVVKVDSKDPRGRPVHVMFDKGEFHQYTLESAVAKLNLLRPIHLVFDNGEVHHYKFAGAKLEQVEQCSKSGPSADLATGGPHGGDVSVKIKWQHGTNGLNAAELVLSPREGTPGPQATPLSLLDSDYQPRD